VILLYCGPASIAGRVQILLTCWGGMLVLETEAIVTTLSRKCKNLVRDLSRMLTIAEIHEVDCRRLAEA
jgi:ribosomal protein L17